MAIVLFGVGQLVLPPLAEHIARDRLARHGRVLSVRVSAFPAIELLFGDAHSVTVRMSRYEASQTQVASDINQAGGVENLKVSIGEVNSGLVTVDHVRMTKHGSQLTAGAEISEANLRAAIPVLEAVTPVASAHGVVTFRGSADLPIVGHVSADATVGADGGKVVLAGTGLLGSLLHLTVWSDPHVDVESIAGRPSAAGMTLSARARLH